MLKEANYLTYIKIGLKLSIRFRSRKCPYSSITLTRSLHSICISFASSSQSTVKKLI